MWSGWAAGRSFFVVEGVGRLAEVGIDEGWRIEWIPGNWMSHQRCAGWLGGKAEFPVV